MKKSTFRISQMDCPSEENLIRLKLAEINSIKYLDFDITNRILNVYHENDIKNIDRALVSLNLGSALLSTKATSETSFEQKSNQSKVLWTILLINLAFFFIEMTTGLISRSMGLVADSLDMLADAFVYGISLLAVGATVGRKKNIAKTAGWFQITLAVIGFIEVIRRFVSSESIPDFSTMIILSLIHISEPTRPY